MKIFINKNTETFVGCLLNNAYSRITRSYDVANYSKRHPMARRGAVVGVGVSLKNDVIACGVACGGGARVK